MMSREQILQGLKRLGTLLSERGDQLLEVKPFFKKIYRHENGYSKQALR
jgi:hypothetical protein